MAVKASDLGRPLLAFAIDTVEVSRFLKVPLVRTLVVGMVWIELDDVGEAAAKALAIGGVECLQLGHIGQRPRIADVSTWSTSHGKRIKVPHDRDLIPWRHGEETRYAFCTRSMW